MILLDDFSEWMTGAFILSNSENEPLCKLNLMSVNFGSLSD